MTAPDWLTPINAITGVDLDTPVGYAHAHRLTTSTVAVNEWGIPEPTPSQELWAEDVAQYAGCPDVHCSTVTVCDPCGLPVCVDHSDFPADCVDGLGPHHEDCVADCVECSAARAQDHAEDRFERLQREGW